MAFILEIKNNMKLDLQDPKKIKVSIIVPIYNKEKILYKCLDSLVNQTMKEIEVILINDGSTDNSETICLDYSEKFPSLVQYHACENGGVSKARNRGIELAKGEYIGFVDSDDWVELNFCEEMFQQTSNKTDCVVCSIKIIKETNQRLIQVKNATDIFSLGPVLRNSVSNKIFNLSVIKKFEIIFPNGSHSYEDFAFVFKFLSVSTKIAYCDNTVYYYFKNQDSFTESVSFDRKNLIETLITIDDITKFLSINQSWSKRLLKRYNRFVIGDLLITHCMAVMRFIALSHLDANVVLVSLQREAHQYYNKIGVRNKLLLLKANVLTNLFIKYPRMMYKFKLILRK